MQMGMIGLGRMGANMVKRLLCGGHDCVVFDRNLTNAVTLAGDGAIAAHSREEFIATLAAPRTIWLMVPAAVVDATVAQLTPLLEPGDVLIDGGNSYYIDDIRRAQELKSHGIDYVDVGTSGGVWGLERGYCLMIGGAVPAVQRLDPLFQTLAPGRGSIPRTPHASGTAEDASLPSGPPG